MTSYGAYEAGLPCKNPNCNSHGRPHPNCQCYGDDMANGGEIKSFCESRRMHDPGCKYYADGGQVEGAVFIDPTHHVAGHIANHGLIGILKMSHDHDMRKYYRSVKKGHKKLDSEVESLLQNERSSPLDDRSKHHKYIEDWLAKGGITHDLQQEIYKQNAAPQPMAKGGEIGGKPDGVLHNHPIEIAHPDQNVMLNSAKGRVSNYLTSLMPQENQPKLAFDSNPDETSKKKKYKNALKIADHPMSVLNEVFNGTITPEHLQHLNSMYPEFNDALQKKITEKITNAQLENKRPNSKIRQGLSLLMGTPLSGDLLPANIVAAQATFASKAQQATSTPQGAEKTGHTAKLSGSDKAYLTGPQTLVSRQQKK